MYLCVCVFVCVSVYTRSQKWIDRNMASVPIISSGLRVPPAPSLIRTTIQNRKLDNRRWIQPPNEGRKFDRCHCFYKPEVQLQYFYILKIFNIEIIGGRGAPLIKRYGYWQYVCIDWFYKCDCVAGPQINTQLYYQSNRTTRNVVFNFPPINPLPPLSRPRACKNHLIGRFFYGLKAALKIFIICPIS